MGGGKRSTPRTVAVLVSYDIAQCVDRMVDSSPSGNVSATSLIKKIRVGWRTRRAKRVSYTAQEPRPVPISRMC